LRARVVIEHHRSMLLRFPVRDDFPALSQRLGDRRLVYLDNAATTQKPNRVIDAVAEFYRRDCANIQRGAHALSARADAAFEDARETVRRFLNAASKHEIIFTHGTTEALNAVADALRRRGLSSPAEVLVTALEHHSNFVPWQRLCEDTGARLVVVPSDARGQLDLAAFDAALNPRTAVVALAHVSNVLGTILPVSELARRAKRHGALVVVDGAQAVAQFPVDVRALGADLYAFSGHKLYAPFGIGALYASEETQRWLAPYMTGGGMVRVVSRDHTSFAPAPARYEAGTPNVSGAIGLARALDYLSELGMPAIAAHGGELLAYARERIGALPRVRLIGEVAESAPIVSFVVEGAHAHDVGSVLDRHGVAVRVGHHCAQPLLQQLGLPATVRASFAVYNDRDDVDAAVAALEDVLRIFQR
jgi:cysteine desulfurase/selenocysteine lyase